MLADLQTSRCRQFSTALNSVQRHPVQHERLSQPASFILPLQVVEIRLLL